MKGEKEKLVVDILSNEEAKSLLIQKLKEHGHMEKNFTPEQPCNRGNPLSNSTLTGGEMWLAFPVQYPFAPYPALRPVPSSPWVAGMNNFQPSSGSV